jgi:hypothetical protein
MSSGASTSTATADDPLDSAPLQVGELHTSPFQGNLERAAQLFKKAQALRVEIGIPPWTPKTDPVNAQTDAMVRRELSEDALHDAVTVGRTPTLASCSRLPYTKLRREASESAAPEKLISRPPHSTRGHRCPLRGETPAQST